MNQLFWKGRKVLLTGHSGFKGSWMSLMLEYLGAEICGYSLPIEKGSFYDRVRPRVRNTVEADIADAKLVQDTIHACAPEIIFHFAAHSSLQGSMDIPDYILKTNIMGTLNILESARHSGTVRVVVIVTSDKCYFNTGKGEAYKEDSVLWASDPYSASKVCQELLSECYRETFFQRRDPAIAIATARASNVVGPGDYNYTRLFPYIFDCFVNGKTPEIRNPHAVRPWQYVLDVLYGYLLLAEKLYHNAEHASMYNGPYNFGPAADGFADVKHVTEIVSKCFRNSSYKMISAKDHIPKETKILMLDSTKARNILGWRPKYSIEDTLRETAQFMKDEKNGQALEQLSREMVRRYFI